MFNASQVKEDLILWIRSYFKKNASRETKAVIGISGGKDSSVVAALCEKALGRDRVLGVLMPQGDQCDIDMSYKICEFLKIPNITVNIGAPVSALYNEISVTGMQLNDIATFNTPARIRMATLYAISGIVGGRVANTCNLSEDYVGYATKFGDAAGDFSPLSNLTVTEVKLIGKSLGLPSEFIEKVPTDGLCGKTDEDNLGFSYGYLDHVIRNGVGAGYDEAINQKIHTLHMRGLHKLNPMPAFDPSEKTPVCSQCHHYVEDCDYKETVVEQCEAPENTKVKMTWRSEEKSYLKHPKKINKHNNCPWFELKLG